MLELNHLTSHAGDYVNVRYLLFDAAITQDVFNKTKEAIIKTIEQELWPLEGCFDEIDELIEEFERKVRGLE